MDGTRSEPRHDWTLEQAQALFDLPFADLIYAAQQVHRAWHEPNSVQMSTLLSIKTGACPEDCGYCPQSVRYEAGVAVEELLPLEQVLQHARAARDAGATRFCMGAAYRSPKRKDLRAWRRWCAVCARWVWRPAPHWACSVQSRRRS